MTQVSGRAAWDEQADELIEELRSIARPRLIVISGPSGVGKDTVIEQMRLRHPDYSFAVTATTRARRPGEIDGVHYIFMSRSEFEDARERGAFLEWAEVYGHLYGVPKDRVRRALRAGKNVVVKVDVQGGGVDPQDHSGCDFYFPGAAVDGGTDAPLAGPQDGRPRGADGADLDRCSRTAAGLRV